MAELDMRDYFAAKALHALLAVTETGGCTRDDFAAESYRFADAMLAAREVEKGAL